MDSNMSNETFAYLIRQILNENCTPVLGAGISYPSKTKQGETDVHKTERMIEIIAKKLCKDVTFEGAGKDKKICENCDKKGKCEIRKEISSGALSKLSQRYTWKENHKKLVEILKIKEFNDLCPTKAHYYLAFLAREGLITEVITTNYDTLMEKAYLKTFGFDDKEIDRILGLQCNEESYKENIVVRIYDRKSFARFSSLKRFENKSVKIDDEAYVLKVYKINGCAFELTNNNNNFYEKILLTSQQLQDWRERQWAADLFRYKLRSTTLLFIGYGSDEPQVLHTMQKVFEESKDDFTNDGNDKGDKSNDNIFEKYSNIPIISVFKQNPSFVHEYIARSFCESINKNTEWEKLMLRHEKILKNSGKRKLPADDLMEIIYFEILKKLLIEALEYSSYETNASFTTFIPNVKYIIREIVDKKLEDLLFVFKKEKKFTDMVSCLPSIIRLFSIANGEKNAYFSIRNNKEGYAEILFILYLILDEEFDKEGFYKDKIELKNKYLYFSFKKQNINKESMKDEEKDIVVFLLGNHSMINSSSSERVVKREKDKIRRNQIFFITWRDIFSDFNDAMNVNEIKKKIKNAIFRPRKYIANSRKSIKKRLKKLKQFSEEV